MKNYPTDEELNAFLEKLEQQELYAPEHLKEEIMKKVFLPELSKTEEKKMVPFAVYVLKMAAGMAVISAGLECFRRRTDQGSQEKT